MFLLKIRFVLLDFWKWGRTYGRTICVKIVITTGRDCGSAEWINIKLQMSLYFACSLISFWHRIINILTKCTQFDANDVVVVTDYVIIIIVFQLILFHGVVIITAICLCNKNDILIMNNSVSKCHFFIILLNKHGSCLDI